MYKKILVTLEATPTDRVIIDHVKQLAKKMGSSVVLFHVATGVPAQYHGSNAGGKEVNEDQEYLASIKAEFEAEGVSAIFELGFGDPGREIIKWVEEKGCDLVAMSTHGHRFFADILFGATASRVRHNISVPVLLLRAR